MADPYASEVCRRIVERAREIIVVLDHEGRIITANPVAEEMLGWTLDEKLNTSIFDLVHPDDVDRSLAMLAAIADGFSRPATAHFRVQRKDLSWCSLEATGAFLDDTAPRRVMVVARYTDDSALSRELMQRLISGERLESVFDVVTRFVSWRHDRVLCTISATESDEHRFVVGARLPATLSGMAPAPGSPWALAAQSGLDQTARTSELEPSICGLARALELEEVKVVPVTDRVGFPTLVSLWTMVDGPPLIGLEWLLESMRVQVELILRYRHQTEALAYNATHDSLTGLANRGAFLDAFALDQPGEHGDALLYLDLDDFKAVNDRFGHAVGDAVLEVVGRRLAQGIRPGDLAARLGGDEFAVLCRDCELDEANLVAERLRSSVGEPIRVGAAELAMGVCVGVAHTTTAARDCALERADRALLSAKRSGRGRVMVATS